MPRPRRELRERVDPKGERVCPFFVAACILSGRPPEKDALCWRIRCQMWEPTKLACKLEGGFRP